MNQCPKQENEYEVQNFTFDFNTKQKHVTVIAEPAGKARQRSSIAKEIW